MKNKIIALLFLSASALLFGQKYITQIELEGDLDIQVIEIMPYNDSTGSSYIAGIAQEKPGLTITYAERYKWPKPYILRNPINVLLTHDFGMLDITVRGRDSSGAHHISRPFNTTQLIALGDNNKLVVKSDFRVEIEPI
jgi:hypothetical protein